MKLLLLLALLYFCLPAEPAYAQSTFSRTYNVNGLSIEVFTSAATPDTGLVVLGWYTDTTWQYSLLFKINKEGDIEWSRRIIVNQNITNCRALAICNDGGIAIGGSESIGNMFSALLIKTDSLGNILWSRKYGTGCHIWDIIQTHDDGFLLSSSTNLGLIDPIMAVQKTDANGNPEWGKYLTGGAGGGFHRVKAVQSADSTYSVMFTSGIVATTNIILYRFDLAGNIILAKYFVSNGEDSITILNTHDNNFLLVGNTNSLFFAAVDFIAIKIDGSGNLLWQKTYGGSGFDYCASATLTPDNGFMMMGSTNSFPSSLGQNHEFYLLKTDSAGNAEWLKTYGLYDDSDILVNATVSADGGIFMAGYLWSSANQTNEIVIIKTDSAGNSGCVDQLFSPQVTTPAVLSVTMSYTEANYDSVSTGSFSSAPFTVIPVTSCYNPVSMQEHESVDGEILIYPNPTNGTFTLSLPELSAETTVHIFSVDGRCVKSLEPRAANTQVDVSGFSDGFYLIEINSKNTHRVERLQITR